MSYQDNNKPLSSREIATMKPGDNTKSDTGENRGLRISCSGSGTKTFFYRYRSPITKKLVQMRLGHFPTMSLAEARIKLQEYRVIRNSGRCPANELKSQQKKIEEQLQQEQAISNFTIKTMIELYLTQHIEDRLVNGKIVSGARKPKGQSEVRRTLYGDAVRALGSKPACLVTRKDVVNLIMEIVGRGSNVQAGNVLRELSAAFDYAIGLGKFNDDFANPALLAKSGLRQAKIRLTHQKGKRVLSDKELTWLLNWLPGSVFTPTQKNVIRFTLWTACRTGEVCAATWSDIDLKNKTWHLKSSKTGIERYVQLPQQVIEFLEQLKLSTGEYLFPSQKTGLPIQQKSLTEQSWRLRETKRMLDIDHWTPHDLRRTVRTGLSRLGCRNEVAEAIIGHSRKGIEGTYDLHSYEVECRIWLQKWADHLDSLALV
ncbi:MAG: tyrosine-type recombinase/integrase [Proteobacteria bacterium]|nr:tyrosine-type recombinase/integrase [Pseudomonadota bacterium]